LRFVCGLIVCIAASLSTMQSGYARQFGEQLRRLRVARNVSQEALADAAKLHRTHISLIERGQRSVRLETIERLARALNLQPAKLMPPLK
jgi:transcriptional regulator with XRE-family HTH domain